LGFPFVSQLFYRLHRPGPSNNSGDNHDDDDDDDRNDGDEDPRMTCFIQF
jgi:hypothetical protein